MKEMKIRSCAKNIAPCIADTGRGASLCESRQLKFDSEVSKK